jgi:hypothetical protein
MGRSRREETVTARLSGMDNRAVASANELSHHLVETAVTHAGYQLVD